MKNKRFMVLLALLMSFAMLTACQPAANNEPTPAPTESAPVATEEPVAPVTTEAPVAPEGGMTVVSLPEYFSKDAWEDDGGDVTLSADSIVFDNGFMGDFAALRMTETFQNVTYKFSVKLEDIPQGLTEEAGTFWDAEFMVLLRSTLAAPGWEDGQTGYSLTAWGDMSKVYIGRAGHDDAFGSIDWTVNDGNVHDIEFSAENNEDNTTVTIKLVIDGVTVFEQVDDGSITKPDRTPLFPNEGGLTIRCKYVKATIG